MAIFQYPVDGPEAYDAESCVPKDTKTPRLYTANGIEYVRTPDSAFEGLAELGYPWEPNYVTVDGMRMHYIDVRPPPDADDDDDDDKEVVLMLHGQPTWSFLYRKMIPVLTQRGYRVICPDWLGMGRSDKPTSLSQHTYLKQVARLKSFIGQVLLPEEDAKITLFVQDWGSLIGLRVVGDEPSWFSRVVSANGLFPVLHLEHFNPFEAPSVVNYNCQDNRTFVDLTIKRQLSSPCDADRTCFSQWIEYALTSPYWKPSDVVQALTSLHSFPVNSSLVLKYLHDSLYDPNPTITVDVHSHVSQAELAMYDAPYPTRLYTSAIRAFPSQIAAVMEPEFGNVAAWESLQQFNKPFLALAGADDYNMGTEELQKVFTQNIPGAQNHDFAHKRFERSGHLIQEDEGVAVAEYLADFINGTATLNSNNELLTKSGGANNGDFSSAPPPPDTDFPPPAAVSSAATTTTRLDNSIFMAILFLLLLRRWL